MASAIDQAFLSVNELLAELLKTYKDVYKLIVYFDNFTNSKFSMVNIEPLAFGIKGTKDSGVDKVGYETILSMLPDFKYIKVPSFLFKKVNAEEKILKKIVIDGDETIALKNGETYKYHKCSLFKVPSVEHLEKLQKEKNEVKAKIKKDMDEAADVGYSDYELDIEF